MIIKNFVKILPLMITFSLFAETVPVLTLREEISPDLKDQTVRVRGFWHPISSHEGFISIVPELKSCCIKEPSDFSHQLPVKGDVASLNSQKIILLEGVLKADLQSPFFVLEQAKEIEQPTSIFVYAIPGLLFIIAIGMAIGYKRF